MAGAPPAGTPAPATLVDQLTRLGVLHQQVLLTAAEFSAAKALLLGSPAPGRDEPQDEVPRSK